MTESERNQRPPFEPTENPDSIEEMETDRQSRSLMEEPVNTEQTTDESALDPVDDSPSEEVVADENLEPRRSTRVRAEPDRLNIGSWNSKSYVVNYNLEHEDKSATSLCSVGQNCSPSRCDLWGRGASRDMPKAIQTK